MTERYGKNNTFPLQNLKFQWMVKAPKTYNIRSMEKIVVCTWMSASTVSKKYAKNRDRTLCRRMVMCKIVGHSGPDTRKGNLIRLNRILAIKSSVCGLDIDRVMLDNVKCKQYNSEYKKTLSLRFMQNFNMYVSNVENRSRIRSKLTKICNL